MENKHGLSVPYDESFWVVPGKFLAGRYPGNPDPEEAERRLRALYKKGVRRIINLMEEHEIDHDGNLFVPYHDTFSAIAFEHKETVSFARYSIQDVSITDHATMVQILDDIDEALASSIPVYIHCWGGRGRTGTVVGCWLARHKKAEGNELLDMVMALRDPYNCSGSAPETCTQADMVINWKE